MTLEEVLNKALQTLNLGLRVTDPCGFYSFLNGEDNLDYNYISQVVLDKLVNEGMAAAEVCDWLSTTYHHAPEPHVRAMTIDIMDQIAQWVRDNE